MLDTLLPTSFALSPRARFSSFVIGSDNSSFAVSLSMWYLPICYKNQKHWLTGWLPEIPELLALAYALGIWYNFFSRCSAWQRQIFNAPKNVRCAHRASERVQAHTRAPNTTYGHFRELIRIMQSYLQHFVSLSAVLLAKALKWFSLGGYWIPENWVRIPHIVEQVDQKLRM